MKNQGSTQLKRVEAKTIADFLPSGLSALQILDSPTVGPTVRICAVGDIGLSGRVEIAINEPNGHDTIFAEVAPLLKSADISFGNLETPLSGELAPGQIFSAPVSGAALLKKSGFNLINLANNHVYDYGRSGFVATLDAVRNAGLIPLGVGADALGAQKLVRTDIDGLRLGWLGCGRTLVPQDETGPHYWEFDEQETCTAVARNRADVDLLIVSIHIGLMHMDYPRPEHKEMAERLFEAGADLILMHHAHVLQGVQVNSKKSVCCYNLGNFIFDWEEGNVKIPMMVREQNEGAIFQFVLDKTGIAQALAFPIWLDDRCSVRWATGTRGVEILDRLARISSDIDLDYGLAFKRQRAARHTSGIVKVLWFHFCRGHWGFVLESIKKVRLEHLGMVARWLGGTLKWFSKGLAS